MRTGFRSRLNAKESMLGSFLKIPSTQPAEILGHLGFDFVVIDEEHAPLNPETTDAILLACRAHGMAGLVRVRAPKDILRVLDSGADGILVPHVSSASVARDVVAQARYAGVRGFSPTTRAGDFGAVDMATHLQTQDARCAVIAMIEDANAIGAIDEIVQVEGLDALFIGRADLAVSMGASAQDGGLDVAVNRVFEAARAKGLALILLAANATEIATLRDLGATAFLMGSDQGFLRAGAKHARDSLF